MNDLDNYGTMLYGFDDPASAARVTAVHRERYEIVCAYGHMAARLKSAVYYGAQPQPFPTTGDYVTIRYNPGGDSLITATLPRTSYFSRRDPSPGRGEQAVAANFDWVFILMSQNRDYNQRRLERYLTLARQSGAVPVVVLTKADLCGDSDPLIAIAQKTAAGADVVSVSAKTGQGLELLAPYLQPGKTAVFLGSSGVGKSSLVNALAGEEIMDTREIREDDSRGRHTTTHRQLIQLPSGVLVIDTPGMRELGMWDVSAGLGSTFSDVEPFLGLCRYSDCRHESEPGCAVKAAITSGVLSRERWESYRRLKSEAAYDGDRIVFLRQKQQKGKSIAKRGKQIQKEREASRHDRWDD